MWLTAVNLGFLLGGAGLYLWARARLLGGEKNSDSRAGLLAGLVLALLSLLAFATARMGMHAN